MTKFVFFALLLFSVAVTGLPVNMTCADCLSSLQTVKDLHDSGSSDDDIVAMTTQYCIMKKMMERPDTLYSAIHRRDGDVRCATGRYYQFCPAGPAAEYDIDMSLPSSPPKAKSSAGSSYYVLQLTDIHVDLAYNESLTADCGRFLCCHNGQAGTGSVRAGKWGTAAETCELPWKTFEYTMSYISKLPSNIKDKIAFVTYTGDSVLHDFYDLSYKTVINNEHLVHDTIVKYMGKSMPVYIAMGYKSQHFDIARQVFADTMIQWVPSPDSDTLNEHAYYATRVPTVEGLKIVALNTMPADGENVYNLVETFNTTYNDGQREWLQNVLEEARRYGDRVLILGHEPSGGIKTIPEYSNWLTKILREYSDVVVATWVGHTHDDHVEVVYDGDVLGQDPVSMIYVNPSMTTYGNVFPSFRLFELNNETHEIMNMYTYRLNLTEANITNVPEYSMAYDALREYNMTDMTPSSWDMLAKRMAVTGSPLSMKYYRNFHQGVVNRGSCDGSCRKEMVCRIMSASADKYKSCIH